jgi:glycosyltransferase involved in cell wall biosynthesis
VNRAAVFVRSYLPFSETFIHDELRFHTRWRVEVFCRAIENRERFPHDEVTTPGGELATMLYRATTYSPHFVKRLREHRVLHAHFGTNAVNTLFYRARLKLPLVVTFHGFDLSSLVGPPRLEPWLVRYRLLAKRVFAKADCFLCPSVEFQDIVARLSKRPDATRLHRLGVDLSRFRATGVERKRQVTMVGRFIEKKGHLDGIAAFARVGARHDASLVIVGAGPLEPRYRERIAELGIADRVRLTGALSPVEIAALLAESAVVIAPSKTAADGDRESGVIVVKEASASGAPVIGTRHGGIPEIIDDGVTGYLVREGDVDAIAQRLDALLADDALRARLGLAGRAKMECEYDVRRSVDALEAVYDEVSR